MPVIDSISDYNWNVLFDEEVNWKYFLLDVNVADDFSIKSLIIVVYYLKNVVAFITLMSLCQF
jgi:hypothetical protein